MASIVRASGLLSLGPVLLRTRLTSTRTLLPITGFIANTTVNKGDHYIGYNHIHPSGFRSQSTNTTPPANFKWDVSLGLPIPDIKPKLEGAILPVSAMSFINKLLFPITFGMMYYSEFLLNYMPWWGAIITTTVAIKLICLPFTIQTMKVNIRTHNALPETQKLEAASNTALATGDDYTVAINRTKLASLLQEHKITFKDRLWPTLAAMPFHLSYFFYLRTLANYPVESIKTGGASWFTNLAEADPYYVLPAISCLSMWITMELGVEGAKSTKMMTPAGKAVVRCVPLIFFAFAQNFPSCIVLYWGTNSIVTLSTLIFTKSAWIKKKFNIPTRIEHTLESLPLTRQTFRGQIRDAFDAGRSVKSTQELRRLDDMAFRKAATAPLKKTYKNLPTQE